MNINKWERMIDEYQKMLVDGWGEREALEMLQAKGYSEFIEYDEYGISMIPRESFAESVADAFDHFIDDSGSVIHETYNNTKKGNDDEQES